jgi:predicted transcriptional regulator
MYSDKAPLGLPTRKKVYSIIEKAPGLHFRELQRRSRMAVGALQYHLEVLEKAHLIKKGKKGKFVRYYSVRKPLEGEGENLMPLLRQEVVRRIAIFLLSRKRAPANTTIAKAVGLSPSTCTFHLKKLEEMGLVEKRKSHRKTLIYLKEPESVGNLLSAYRKSFLDELVDNFADIWDELQ